MKALLLGLFLLLELFISLESTKGLDLDEITALSISGCIFCLRETLDHPALPQTHMNVEISLLFLLNLIYGSPCEIIHYMYKGGGSTAFTGRLIGSNMKTCDKREAAPSCSGLPLGIEQSYGLHPISTASPGLGT